MLSAASEGVVPAEVRLSGAAAPLLDELLHAMGQPLTSLQLCRVPAMRDGGDEGGREMLEEFAGQVESLTEMYRALRLLLEGGQGEVEPMEAGLMVRRLERDWQRRAARRRVGLRVEIDAAAGRVLGGAGVEQGLDQIFDAVLSGAAAGSIREVTVRGGEAEVTFGGWQSGAAAAETWMLRVARVLIERAGGDVIYTGQPMCARVRFARA